MKRFIFAFAAVLSIVSCLEDGGTRISDRLYTTFEYSYVSDSFTKDSIYVEGPFVWSNLLTFMNKVDKDGGEFKGGFALSCLQGDVPVPEKEEAGAKAGAEDEGAGEGTDTDVVEPAAINPFRAYAPKGARNTYAVFFQTDDMPGHDVLFNATKTGTCIMQACYVNNTVEVVEYVKNTFEPGNRITLKAVGSLAGVQTGTAEINLADYSDKKDSVVTNWTMFDLSKLGSVDAVDFEIISSKDVPEVFCMDVMVADITLNY